MNPALWSASVCYRASLEKRQRRRVFPWCRSEGDVHLFCKFGTMFTRNNVVCWLLNVPASYYMYLRDGSARTIVPRLKLQIKLSTSPSHSILTPGRPVPALTLQRRAPGRVATGVSFFKVTGMTRPGKIPLQAGFEPRIFRSRGGRLNH